MIVIGSEYAISVDRTVGQNIWLYEYFDFMVAHFGPGSSVIGEKADIIMNGRTVFGLQIYFFLSWKLNQE